MKLKQILLQMPAINPKVKNKLKSGDEEINKLINRNTKKFQ